MTTGIENWLGSMADLGPLYPFVGSEFVLWIIGVALWLVWQISCTRAENRQYQEEIDKHGGKKSLADAIDRE